MNYAPTIIKSSTKPTCHLIRGSADEIIGERPLVEGDTWVNDEGGSFVWIGTYWLA